MLKDLKKVEAKIRALDPIPQSIMASYIWWKLCNKRGKEELVGIKSMINYNAPHQSPEYIEELLYKFGFSADHSQNAVKSLRTVLKHRLDMINK